MKLLDTAVLIDIDHGEVPKKVKRLDEEGRHVISIVSLTELRLGVEKLYRKRKGYGDAVRALDRLFSRFEIIPVKRSEAVAAAEIIADLEGKGRPVQDLHDVYIAATALVKELPVLTPNVDHFEPIPDLVVEDWSSY